MMWATVPNTQGHYEASDDGQLRRVIARTNTRSGKILKPRVNRHGYPQVTLCINGKKISRPVHRLVVESFHGLHPGMSVNHINGIKTDNRIQNIEFVTNADNSRHASKLGLLCNGDDHWTRLRPEDIPARKRTHCPSGHPLDGIRSNGFRFCRTCKRTLDRSRYRQNRDAIRTREQQRYVEDKEFRNRAKARAKAYKRHKAELSA